MDIIKREAEVLSVKNGSVTVRYLCPSACGQCPAKEKCLTLKERDRRAEIKNTGQTDFVPGEKVIISLKASAGWKAVAFVYILPLFAVLLILSAGLSAGVSEVAAGAVSLLFLPLWYGMLRLFGAAFTRNDDININKLGE